jgi:hypothetical protein
MHPRIQSTLLFIAASFLLGIISQASKRHQPDTEMASAPPVQQLSEPLVWEVSDKEVLFKFPDQVKDQNITGSVHITSTSNKHISKTYRFVPGTGLGKCISTEWLEKGEYKMRVEWKANNNRYYSEGLLSLK